MEICIQAARMIAAAATAASPSWRQAAAAAGQPPPAGPEPRLTPPTCWPEAEHAVWRRAVAAAGRTTTVLAKARPPFWRLWVAPAVTGTCEQRVGTCQPAPGGHGPHPLLALSLLTAEASRACCMLPSSAGCGCTGKEGGGEPGSAFVCPPPGQPSIQMTLQDDLPCSNP